MDKRNSGLKVFDAVFVCESVVREMPGGGHVETDLISFGISNLKQTAMRGNERRVVPTLIMKKT